MHRKVHALKGIPSVGRIISKKKGEKIRSGCYLKRRSINKKKIIYRIPYDDDEEDDVEEDIVRWNIFNLPELTEQNYRDVVAENPLIRLFELKSLQLSYSISECKLINKVLRSENTLANFNPYQPGWLDGIVIDAYLSKICKGSHKTSTIGSTMTQYYIEMADAQDLPNESPCGTNIDWNGVEMAFFPISLYNLHWILLVVWPKNGVFAVLDPNDESEVEYEEVERGVSKLNAFFNTQLTRRCIPITLQENDFDCGVLVSAYVFWMIVGLPTTIELDTSVFRNTILCGILMKD